MKLKSFGCSFIFGTDLHDDGSGKDYAQHSHFTYPALLAKELGYSYECHARAGAGNLQIFHRLIDEIAKKEPTLYVINWTWIDRFSYVDERQQHDRNPVGWQTIMPSGENKITEFYYRNLHSEMRDKLTSLIFIKTAIDSLLYNKCAFIMTSIDSLMLDKKWHVTLGIQDMQDYIDPYISDFCGLSFLDWAKQKGFKISETLHPLEDAHAGAANLIYSNLGYYIKSKNL